MTGSLTLIPGTGISITPGAGTLTISNTEAGGTVTNFSFVNANGFAGTVTNPTTTPALTLTTTVTGILYGNGTSITTAVPSNFPTLNQNTTGTASNITATTNSTLTTLSALSLPGSQVIGNISGSAANITATTNSTLTTLSALSLPYSQLTGTPTVSGFTPGSVLFASATGTITQDNANFFWNDTNFSLGISNNTPAANTFIDGINTTGAAKRILLTGYGAGSTVGTRGRFANGTLGTPTAATAGNILNFWSGLGYGTSQFAASSTGAINVIANETFTNTSNATYLQFEVTPTTSVTIVEAMRLNSTGNLLINTTTDTGQKLQVNGTAIFSGSVTDSVAPIFSTLTGYLYGNGASAVTASTTIPASTLSGTVPVANGGTNATTVAGARTSLGIDAGAQFITSGTTYTTPANITVATQFKFTLVGGGAGGTSPNSIAGGGAGGGGGGALVLYVSGLAASNVLNIAIGSGGAGSTSLGSNGGNTTLTIGVTTYTASGGVAPTSSATTAEGGVGGTATNGTINISGSNGDAASGVATAQSGGGGNTGFGLGLGGNGVIGSSSGNNGTGFGGGGGGAKGNGSPTSGSGTQGAILVEYWN